MQKLQVTFFSVLILVSVASGASAQSTTPRWELMGGVTSYLAGGEFAPYMANGQVGLEPGQLPTEGFQVGLSRSIKSYLRVTGEFNGVWGREALAVEHLPYGGQYKVGSEYIGLFGPEATFRKLKRFDFFAHYLIGFARGTDNQVPAVPNNSNTAWIYALGFGIDLKTGHRFAIRLVGADWVTSHFPKQDLNAEDNWRYTTGVVYRFGH